MKRSAILWMLLGILVVPCFGQTGERTMKYFDKTEFGFSFGIASYKTDVIDGIRKTLKNNEIVLSLQSINGLMFYNRVGVGVGIGAELWQHGLFFPLFGYASYALKPTANTFYGNLSCGYSFGNRYRTTYNEAGTGGLMFSAAIGYSRQVASRLRFQFEAFYRYQAIQSEYNVYVTDTLRSTVDYKVPLNFIGFRIGILFK